MEKMGLEILEASSELVVGRVPVEGNTQPYGLFHGGASGALAEALAVLGAGHGKPSSTARAIEIKVNHVKAVTGGTVTGTARRLSNIDSSQLWEIRMHNDDGDLTAYSTATVDLGEEDA
jgi:1,4-dihydroxy-2-naphthoyl-CoA hydrolase